MEVLEQALDLDPQSASAHYNPVSNLAKAGDYAEAESHFRAAVEVLPSAETYTGLGYVQLQQGRFDDAIGSLNQAIEVDPTIAGAYGQLGSLQVQQGELEQAESTYRRLVRNQPSASAHQELAQVLMRMGRTSEAAQQMEMARALERNTGAAR